MMGIRADAEEAWGHAYIEDERGGKEAEGKGILPRQGQDRRGTREIGGPWILFESDA